MKVAQVAPLIESVPPVRYGGTERIVSYLTEELVALGHDVTLFASADSITNGHLFPGADKALRYDKRSIDHLATHMIMLENFVDYAQEFDFIHFHTGDLHYALTRKISTPHITTHHGRLDIPELEYFYKDYYDIPVVSVSYNQRKPFPQCNWIDNVYDGIPDDLYDFSTIHKEYLAFLGRISPEKGILEAIEIAQRAGMELKIAGKVDSVDEEFFNSFVKPRLNDPRIEFIGEINNTEKNFFLGNACALLFPVQWSEPSGLVMIESMACGTPVIAFRRGSVEEILQHGVTGYVVDNVGSAVKAVEQIEILNRKKCREIFCQQYSAKRMVDDYLQIYRFLAETDQPVRLGVEQSSHEYSMTM